MDIFGSVFDVVNQSCSSCSNCWRKEVVDEQGQQITCGRSSTGSEQLGQAESCCNFILTMYLPQEVKPLIHLVMNIFIGVDDSFLALMNDDQWILFRLFVRG